MRAPPRPNLACRRLVPCLALLALVVSPTPASAQRTLTLADAMELLEEENLDVSIADNRVEQADDMRRQALSMLRPTINLSAAYTLRDEEIELDFGNPFEPLAPFLDAVYSEHAADYPDLYDPATLTQPTSGGGDIVQYRHDVSGSLTIDQSLYNARALPYIRQARIGVRQAENGRELVLHNLRGAVTQSYFAAVLQHRFVDVAERNVELARLAHESAVIAYEEDVGNRFEINRTQVELSRAERDVENARTAYRIAIRNLATLLDTEADFDVAQPPEITTAPADPSVPADTPELIGHRLELERQGERQTEVRNRWFPSLYARAQANLQRESAFAGDRFSWFLQIGASWDLWDGGEAAALRDLREEELLAEELRRDQTVAQLEAAIDNALLRIEQLERDVASAAADVELGRENLQLTDTAVLYGTATALDAQVAREQLYLSELSLATAEVNLQASIYDLLRLLGGTPWE